MFKSKSKKTDCFFIIIVIIVTSFYSVQAQTVVNSLAELQSAIQLSNQTIVLTPGDYNIESLPSNSRFFHCTGSNNTIDLTGVYIDFPVGSSEDQHFLITGNSNTLQGGVFENTYASGIEEITDYVAYNQDKSNFAYGADPHLVIQGDGNTVIGMKLTIRGSFPYGYGSMYGINNNNVFGLDKRGGIAVQGTNVTIDGCELQMKAFGHGIYIQSPSDHTIIRNTLVEGDVRSGADLYAETDSNSLPYRSDYLDYSDYDNPLPIDIDNVFSLCEDGIRVYTNGGSVEIENCTVKKMRGGIRTYLSSGATVTNSTAIDCGNTNWNLPNGGKVTNSSGNFAYAPLSDFRLGRSNTNIEWTIISSPHAMGSHNLTDILGDNHNIVFHRTEGPLDTDETRAIVVSGDNSTIVNETEYAIVLEASSSGNTIHSCGGGTITDNGTSNTVIVYDDCEDFDLNNLCPKTAELMEAECFDSMSGIQTEDSSEGGLNIGYINDGNWVKFVDIDLTGIQSVNARTASKYDGGYIEVFLDDLAGTLIATIPVTNRSGWQNWGTDSADINAVISGAHDVYFVFRGTRTGSLFNVNWFGFSTESLSIDSNALVDNISIYPNPATKELSVSIINADLNSSNTKIILYTITGQKVLEVSPKNNRDTTLDLSNIQKGVYILMINDKSKVLTKKIVKI